MIAIAGYSVSSKAVNWDDKLNLDNFALVFDDSVLVDCESTYILDDNNLLDMWNFDIENYLSPTTDGWGIQRHNATTRDLNFQLYIQWDDREGYEQSLDRVKEILTTTEWFLEFTLSWERRKLKTSINWFAEQSQTKNKINIGIFDVSMLAIWDIQTKYNQSQVFTNFSQNWQIFVENDGSKLMYPDIFVTFGTWSSWITKISLVVDWYTFSVTWSYNAWDTIVMYWENADETKLQLAYLDWVQQESDWRYPRIKKGGSIVFIQFEGWAVANTQVSFSYKNKRY